jgi:hypothetical protein
MAVALHHPPPTIEVALKERSALIVVVGSVSGSSAAVLTSVVDRLLASGVRRAAVDLSCAVTTDPGARHLVAELSARSADGVRVVGGRAARLSCRRHRLLSA